MLILLLCSLLLCVFCVMGVGGGRQRTAGGLSRWSMGVLLLVSGAAQADLVATVSLASGAAGTIAPGETTTLRVRLTNTSTASGLTDVGFNYTLPGVLPNGLKMTAAPVYTCTDGNGANVPTGGTLTTAVGGQAITLSGATIPQASSSSAAFCTLDLPVTGGSSSGSATSYDYSIVAASVTGKEAGVALSNSGSAIQTIFISATPLPTLEKSFSATDAVLGGAPITLTLKVNNPASAPLPNFVLTDSFPLLGGMAAIKVASPPNATVSCPGGTAPTFAPAAGDIVVTATGGTVAANSSCTLTVQVEANTSNGKYLDFAANVIPATNLTNNLGLVPAAGASANITVKSPLRVGKAFAHATLSSGQSDFFTLTLWNDGNAPLTVSLTDNPMDTEGGAAYGLKLDTGASTTCAGGVVTGVVGGRSVTLTGGTVPAGGSCTVTVPFTGTAQTAGVPITYTNTLPVGAVTVTGKPEIISNAVSSTVMVAMDLKVSKTAAPSIAAPGSPVAFQITVENYSASAMNNVTIVDHLGANRLSYLTGVLNGKDYSPTSACGISTPAALNAADVTFTLGTLPARSSNNTPGSCTILFWAMIDPTAPIGTAITNTIENGGVCTSGSTLCNGAPSNGASSTTAKVLSITKAFSPAGPLSEGTVSRMTITLNNKSVNPITGASITDPMPTNASGMPLQIASPANAASTCGGTIVAAAGSTSLGLNGGVIPARAGGGTGADGSCQVQVDVVGAAGTYNNIATADGTETLANRNTRLISTAYGGAMSATATLTYTASLGATKSFNPASVSSGGKSTVTIRLSNGGAVPLTNVSATDPLPAGMLLATPPNAYTTCGGATTVTAAAGGNSASLVGASLAAGANCDFLFDIVTTGAGPWANTLPVGNVTANGGVKNTTPITATLGAGVSSALVVSKSTNPNSLIFPGQVSRLSITVTNGTEAVTDLRFTDYFTAGGASGAALNGMVLAPNPAASTTCPGGVVTATANARSVSLSGASLAPNAVCTVDVNVTSLALGAITNTIPASSLQTDQGLTNASAANTSLGMGSQIGVIKQFLPNPVQPNQRSRLRITFYNPTAAEITNVLALDNLPGGITIPSGSNPVTTCVGGVVTAPTPSSLNISGAKIAPTSGGAAGSCYSEIDVVAAAEGDFVNTIPVGAVTATSGGASINNTQATTDTLKVKKPLVINKAFDDKTLDVGNPAGFTTGWGTRAPGAAAILKIKLTNPNSTVLTGANFTDSLPAGLVVATTPAASSTCGGVVTALPSATSVRFTGGTLAANSVCTLAVSVLSNIPGTYTNQIPAGGVTTFEGVSNEEATNAKLVVSSPVGLSKAFSPTVIPANGTATLTFTLGNPNSSAITLTAALTDTLPSAPGQMTVAALPAVVSTCTGAVTAVAGATSITLANGTSIPAGGCTVSVNVTASAIGGHINSIPVGALQTNVGSNQAAANATLLVSTQGYISGKVFKDNNTTPNGTFETGTDTPLAGVAIELRSGATCAGALITSTTTDAAGNYLFSGLGEGVFSVCEPSQPAGTTNGSTVAGGIVPVNGSTGTAGVGANPTSTSSQIANIRLKADGPAGEVSGSTGNNFAEVVPSSIAGTVFLDQNNNGIQNGSDNGLSGVMIQLLNSGGAVVATTTTDASGNYSFTNLQPGVYSVSEPNQPTGSSNGITTAGSVAGGTAGTATGVAVLPSKISNLVLPPNTAATGNNFAEIPNGRVVQGRVFADANKNGTFESGDSGLSGQTLTLTGNDINGNAVSLTTTTAADGSYTFSGVPEGNSYTLTQPTQPPSTTNGITTAGSTGGVASAPTVAVSTITGLNLSGLNTVSADNNFAEIPAPAAAAAPVVAPRTVSGRSWAEGDNNGIFDPTKDTPIVGATVTLIGTTTAGVPITLTTTTGADGTYTFTNVPEGGNYRVVHTPLGNTQSSIAGVNVAGTLTASPNNNFVVMAAVVTADLSVSTTHQPPIFISGSDLGTYTLTPTNPGTVASTGTVTVVQVLPDGITPVGVPTGTGWACSVAGQMVSCTSSAPIPAGGQGTPIVVRAAVASGLGGRTLTATTTIAGGGEASTLTGNNTSVESTAIVTLASLAGHVWLDQSHTRTLNNPQSVPQAGWTVELLLNGSVLNTTSTDAAGAYSFTGLMPGSGYQVRFRHPTTGLVYGAAVPNEQGAAFTNGVIGSSNPAGASNADGTLSSLTLLSGANVVEQSLPLDPAGRVYDTVTRKPVAGAVITINGPAGFNPALHLLGGVAVMTTGADGLYQFLLNASAPSGVYTLSITRYPAGYVPAVSSKIPACVGTLTVGATPSPALVQVSNGVPALGIAIHNPNACEGLVQGGARTTQYYLSFNINMDGRNRSADIVNNHIGLDPVAGGVLRLTKTTPLMNVSQGDLIPYTITATNAPEGAVSGVSVVDRIPAGFRYRQGTATVNGVLLEPQISGRDLMWSNQNFAANQSKVVRLVLVAGAGAGEGEHTNQAWAASTYGGGVLSNIATAAVRIVPDATFDCSDIIGKVFDDKNANGYQDQGESGIPNVRVVTARGLLVTTDAEGRFHVPCAAVPQSSRGSNFVMKLDERTLPSGYRLTTENPRDVRVTRGKMVKLNFGATVHKVFRLELDDRAFVPDHTALTPEWADKLPALVQALQARPAVLRLAYRQGAQADWVQPRLVALQTELHRLYPQRTDKTGRDTLPDIPPLVIEVEVIAQSAVSGGQQ